MSAVRVCFDHPCLIEEHFVNDISDKLNTKQLVTPLDMDMLAAKIVYVDNQEQLDFIETIFEQYRKTQPALFVRESMHHSFVRSYMNLSQNDKLLDILSSKVNHDFFTLFFSCSGCVSKRSFIATSIEK
jgi:hypothetical protein